MTLTTALSAMPIQAIAQSVWRNTLCPLKESVSQHAVRPTPTATSVTLPAQILARNASLDTLLLMESARPAPKTAILAPIQQLAQSARASITSPKPRSVISASQTVSHAPTTQSARLASKATASASSTSAT